MGTSITPAAQVLLELFREQNTWIPALELGQRLDLAPEAVYRSVELLREEGYDILSQDGAGYTLVGMPNSLSGQSICNGLESDIIGKELRIFDTIDSTNLEAIRLAQEGAGEGLAVLAEFQSQGRGRSGRSWFSPPGLNVYCSVILRPPIPTCEAPRISLLAAVAASWSCWRQFDFLPSIKWPNDLLYKGKKLAGILSEMSAESQKVRFVVLGIGINVNASHALLPPELALSSTSIREVLGRRVSRERYVRALLGELDQWYQLFLREGFHPIREEWIRLANIHGQAMQVRNGDGTLVGKALGLHDDGSLLLQAMDGTIHRVITGDIVLEARV